ncbi:oligosaccharide repeat unit polymerase [Corallincola holothuriorum]|uniref:Oligosaccharide repeat unit polymerase n=1 Tax=Corallincola holothuriorum TaxID=2282215 RepID=A0A368N167_9GAMM|nr:O-antigen polymerase [Corallincola holothuriorum]RCU43295.1 oligosaccharide repeat unit polymerase [Corallincola holothuriorum]
MMRHFGLFFLCFWWVLWLTLSYSSINPIKSPSTEVTILYLISFFSIVLGYFFVIKFIGVRRKVEIGLQSVINNKHINNSLFRYSYISLGAIISSLYYVGAFSTSFSDYFFKVRGGSAEALVSGSGLIDYGLKVVIYPIMLAVTLLIFSSPDGKKFKLLLVLNILFFLLFSYFFQVNYPMILLFVIIFHSQFNPCVFTSILRDFRKRSLIPLVLLCLLVVAAAFNRFGSHDIGGMLSHYLVSYHTLGFAFFDFYYQEDGSLLHEHSFGLSMLASFDFIFSYFVNFFGVEYIASSTQNVMNNSIPINLGRQGSVNYGNAFGTYLFTFYRDFNFVGVFLYSVLYGAILGVTNKKSMRGDRFSYSLYLYFISMGTIGMYVSPLDYSYFWIVPIIIFCIKHKFSFSKSDRRGVSDISSTS